MEAGDTAGDVVEAIWWRRCGRDDAVRAGDRWRLDVVVAGDVMEIVW